MAPRNFWKGHLRLSLVTCQVTLVPAVSARNKLRFNTLNGKTGNRVESRYVDEHTGKVVPHKNQRRAYPMMPDNMIIMEEAELDAVALDSSRVIDIEMFVARDDIPWIYLDRPYYLLPSDKITEDAYGVIRDAMVATQTVGIARIVLFRREHAVMLCPQDNGIVVWTLRYGDEVREAETYFSQIDRSTPGAQPLKLFRSLIRDMKDEWNADMLKDPVQKRLKSLIASKKRKSSGAPRSSAKAASRKDGSSDNVVSITDALRQSLKAARDAKSDGKS
ncbi:MAG: Ku protein [Paracoccaceae bacterium]|nr:Ku protein [Paracoccaceae bacterium]